MKQNLTVLQAGRGLAALAVLLFHQNGYFGAYLQDEPLTLLRAGGSGVWFFFVLSGFIMVTAHRSWIGAGRSGEFLWRRFVRIYPTYWIILAGLIGLCMIGPWGDGSEQTWQRIVPDLALVPTPKGPILFQAWTLSFEVVFYLVFSILMARRAWWGLLFGVTAAAWLAGVFLGGKFATDFLTSPFFLLFALGGACALFPAQKHHWLWAGAGAAIFLAMAITEAYFGQKYEAGYGLGSAAMIVGFVGLERRGVLKSPAWLHYLGDASYSIYLTHGTVISAFGKLVRKVQGPHLVNVAMFIVMAACVAGAGCLFHSIVEKQVLRWVAALRPNSRGPGAARPEGPAAETPGA